MSRMTLPLAVLGWALVSVANSPSSVSAQEAVYTQTSPCADGSCQGVESLPYGSTGGNEGVFSRFLSCCGMGRKNNGVVSAAKFSGNRKTCLTVCPPYCHPTHGYHETCWNKFPPVAPCYKMDTGSGPNSWSSPTPDPWQPGAVGVPPVPPAPASTPEPPTPGYQ